MPVLFKFQIQKKTFGEVELGPFDVSVLDNGVVLVYSENKSDDGWIHPNCHGRWLCAGDAGQMLEQAIYRKDLYSVQSIVDAILSGYEPGSEFEGQSLENWRKNA